MRIIPTLFALIAMLWLPVEAIAQNCGCAEEGNCPVAISPNTNSTVCYEITDAFNNDLSDPAQGVCGVYLRFRHGRIGDLKLTLTAPDGTQVTLVDATGSCSTFTPVALWDILFVPCADTCEPDTVGACPYPCVFDGCPASCGWQNANYTGSYHPFVGCLEGFNSGPVNGQWCIEIENGAPFNGGELFDFRVFLCDQSGLFCCDADAGNTAFIPDVAACEGDSTLLLSPAPVYGALEPPDSTYGYTFGIFQSDSLMVYDTLTDLRSYPAGIYEVCGISFLYADSTDLPAAGSPISPDSIFQNLNGPSPAFCGDIDTNCIVVSISAPIPPQFLTDTICLGDTVLVGLTPYTATGLYSDTLSTPGGCDSVVHLALTVLPSDTIQLTDTICSGSVVVVGNDTLQTTGVHEVLLQNQFGCDSLVVMDLFVVLPDSTFLVDTLCGGDTVYIGTTPFSETGTHVVTLGSFFNCDSVVILELTVIEIALNVEPSNQITCTVSEVTLDAIVVATTGTPTYAWSTMGGNITGPLDEATTTADAPGIYTVAVNVAGCSLSAGVAVGENKILPTALPLITGPDTLTCAVDSVQLDGSGSSGQGVLSYAWSALNGSPLSHPDSAFTTVADADVYQLIVVDSLNGCADTATIEVLKNTVRPSANAGPDDTLTCTSTTLQLNGSASSAAGGVQYLWSALSGNLLPPFNVPDPTTDAPGTYQLIVTDMLNDCRDTDLVVVAIDTLSPQAALTFPEGNALTCSATQLSINAAGSSGNLLSYQWLGPISSGQGSPVAWVNQPGTYGLLLTDGQNGCTDSASAVVGLDTVPPVADAGPPGSVSCTVLSVTVGGNTTSSGPGFSYQWSSAPGGAFNGPTNERFATVTAPATYYLTVIGDANGCTAQDSTVIADNANPPVANAGPDGVIDCDNPTVVLDGSNSTIVPFTLIEWYNSAGVLLGNTVQMTVNYPDTFVLHVQFAFCEDRDTVIVTAIAIPPVAEAGPDGVLDCLSGQFLLDGSASDSGAGIVPQWSTTGGAIDSGTNTYQALAGAPGTYVLAITNQTNNCTSRDTVVVTLDTAACLPQAYAGADGLVNCYNVHDTLQASGSAGGPYAYAWTAISGTVVSVANPFAPVVSSGQFVFSVTNTAVGLMVTDTVSVVADTIHPVANAHDSLFLSLTCPQLEGCYPLNVAGTSTGPQYVYNWESLNGTLCTAPDQLNAEVQGTGIYSLRVTDTLNGCNADDAVLVQLLDFAPVAGAGAPMEMECGDTSIVLNGAGSSQGFNYQYNWFSNGGLVLSGGNTLQPVVAAVQTQDTFFIEVLNTVNLCRDTAGVIVFAATGCFPTCSATVSGPITCTNSTVTLSAAGSTFGAITTYGWTTATGSFCGATDSLFACANAPGSYLLTVTNTFNGVPFSTSCQVQVQQNTNDPIAEAGQNQNLTCMDTVLTLDGSASASGPQFRYAWSAAPGNILSGSNTQSPVVDAIGLYTLLVTDTINGCTATGLVVVGLDTLHPIADAGMTTLLTCSNNTATLNGSALPGNAEYHWTTTDGNICDDPSLPNPVICAAGSYLLTVTIPTNGCTDTASVTITADDDFPVVSVGQDLTYSCADTLFVLLASATGQNPLSYQWTTANGGCISGPADVLQPTATCPGLYTLTVTDDANDCTASAQMQIVADTTAPSANPGQEQQINCQQFQVTLNGTASAPAGQLNFLWVAFGNGHLAGPTDQPSATADAAGLYLLTVTNTFNQCTDTASVLVTIADISTADAGPDTTLTCARTSLNLDGSASSAGLSVLYQWFALSGNIVQGANTNTPLIDEPGTYLLQLEDTASLCLLTDTVVVGLDTVSPAAIVALPVDTVTCAQSTITLDGSASIPADSLTFTWTAVSGTLSGPVDQPTAQAAEGGTYTLEVAHLRNGCKNVQTVVVAENREAPSVAFATAPELNCSHPEVQPEVLPPGPGSQYSYQWSGPPPIVEPNTPTPTVSNSGWYSVTVTDPLNGCEANGAILITANFATPKAKAAAQGTLDCDSEQILLSGTGSTTGDVTYQWSTSGGGAISAPSALTTLVNAPGWYYLSVQFVGNGCTAVDSVEVVSLAELITSATLTLTMPDCFSMEGSISIDTVYGGVGPYFYSIGQDIAITQPEFLYLKPGPYTLLIEDPNGCTWDTTLYLKFPEEVLVELGPDQFIRLGETVNLEALLNIPLEQVDTLWWQHLPDSTECPSCLEQTVGPLETTVYRITVVDVNGCSATDKVTIWVNNEAPVYVPSAFSPNGDGVNDKLLLFAGDEVDRVQVFRIFDRWGNLVFLAEQYPPNDPNYGWDGAFEGQVMDPAVFVWMAEVHLLNGRIAVLHGDVALLR